MISPARPAPCTSNEASPARESRVRPRPARRGARPVATSARTTGATGWSSSNPSAIGPTPRYSKNPATGYLFWHARHHPRLQHRHAVLLRLLFRLNVNGDHQMGHFLPQRLLDVVADRVRLRHGHRARHHKMKLEERQL